MATTAMRGWGRESLDDVAAIVGRGAYERYGLRVMTVYRDDVDAPAVGAALAPSSVWIDGDPTDETLDGTSGLCILDRWDDQRGAYACDRAHLERMARMAGSYFGRYVVLMAGQSGGKGEDLYETVIRDAVVLAVYDRGRECCDEEAWR